MSSKAAQESAAAAAEAAFFEALDEATKVNMKISKYYAAAIAGLIALFTVCRWTHLIFANTTKRSNPISRAFGTISTPVQRGIKGFTAVSALILPGRIIMFLTYLGINVGMMFPQLDFSINAVFLAKRCGWYDALR